MASSCCETDVATSAHEYFSGTLCVFFVVVVVVICVFWVLTANQKIPRLAHFLKNFLSSVFSRGGFVQLRVKRFYEWTRTGRG